MSSHTVDWIHAAITGTTTAATKVLIAWALAYTHTTRTDLYGSMAGINMHSHCNDCIEDAAVTATNCCNNCQAHRHTELITTVQTTATKATDNSHSCTQTSRAVMR